MEKSGIKNKGDKISESDSSKSDLDKDDEDFLARFDVSKPKSDKDSDKDKMKDGKSTPEKSSKKSLDLSDYSHHKILNFGKHKRSGSNNSFDSIDNFDGLDTDIKLESPSPLFVRIDKSVK